MTDIRSAQIRDGTIVDVDIAAAAAIAFSKLKRLAVDSTATGAQNNWALGLGGGDGLVTWHGAADLQVTGLAAGVAGQIVILKNTGTKIATFAHNSGSSSAGNKLFNFATSAPTPVAAGGFVAYQYDGTQWQIIGHDQGAWITPTYSAGNFFAGGSMTWTVDAGDVSVYAYRLSGRTIEVAVSLETTSIGGSVNRTVHIAIPGSFLAAKATTTLGIVYDNSTGVFNFETFFTAVGSGNIDLVKSPGTFSLSTNLTYVYVTIVVEVQ